MLTRTNGIQTDRGTQSRCALDEATVERYRHDYENNVALPPPVAFKVGEELILADGFHRLEAAKRAGIAMINVEVRDGGMREAILCSVTANTSHGLPPRIEDKRRAVQMLLADPEWSAWSDREIARRCGVSHPFVADQRRRAAGNVTSEPTAAEDNRTAGNDPGHFGDPPAHPPRQTAFTHPGRFAGHTERASRAATTEALPRRQGKTVELAKDPRAAAAALAAAFDRRYLRCLAAALQDITEQTSPAPRRGAQ